MLRCEEDALVAADFEEIFQYAHVQRLAKPARTREQINLSPVRHQIDDQSSFIYIIEILLPYFFIISMPTGSFCVFTLPASLRLPRHISSQL